MKRVLTLAVLLLVFAGSLAEAAKEAPAPARDTREEVQSDISTREIAIQSNFTGIEILIYGSIDFSQTSTPDTGTYDVIMVIRSPDDPLIARRKVRVAGIWINGPGKVYPSVPGFYAALSTRPFRAVASDEALRTLGIGFGNLDFGRATSGDPDEETFRSSLIRLKQKQKLFQEDDDGVRFVGRSLFRATVVLPVNVPTGRYTTDIYLFRDGEIVSQNRSTLEVSKAGFEGVIYRLAYAHPFFYGVFAVVLAMLAGLAGWYTFRREGT
jgi:uncharacterized protein (TIGR02186 family)